MLAGLNLQPGAWDATEGELDDVLISDVTMHNVNTPFHFSLKPGNTAGTIVVNRVTATGVYRAASSVESWADNAFANVVFRDVTIEYTGGGTKQQASMSVKSPGVDARPLPAWGFYIRNVDSLQFDNVRLRCVKEDLRPAIICDGVRQLTLDGLRFRRAAGAEAPLVLDNVEQLAVQQTDLALVQPQFRDIELASQDDSGRFLAGGKYAVSVTVENGNEEGLARIELAVAEQKTTRWVWLRAGEKEKVVFDRLVAPGRGIHQVRVGPLSTSLIVEERR
jgi:hypothetical protein